MVSREVLEGRPGRDDTAHPTCYTYFSSPLGLMLLTSIDGELTGLFMREHKHGEEVRDDWVRNDEAALFGEVKRQLAAYFDGRLREFDLPIGMRGTEFQRRVWEELVNIPYGMTTSYGELARKLGNPGASRAVGLANGRNPISIIVPCHRVIGAGGKLVGYGGGLPRKASLLEFEFSVLVNGPRSFEGVDGEDSRAADYPRMSST